MIVGARATRRRWLLPIALVGALEAFDGGAAMAGPPYTTDDPEPVEYRHWEVYVASQTLHEQSGWSGTAPHVEVNYGAIPNVQLHVIAPLAYDVSSRGNATYGLGDTEIGVKFRFLQEHKWTPMIGTFPLVELPTGSRARGLGDGATQVFVPMWLQKSFDEWTTYGGWGVWFDTASANRHWWFFGWQAQRKLGEHLALGGEVFHDTPEVAGATSDTRFNVGAIVDATETHHLLVSAGRSFVGPSLFQAYLAYQLTVGP